MSSNRPSAVGRRQSSLPLETDAPELPDAEARRHAVDPSRNVVLEASAGTGKTRVLVDRYVNLLGAGVDPDHILAITFTRKAATEMRQRIIGRLRDARDRSHLDAAIWRDLRNRLGDIAISTIDAFCLSLLREFPLEAEVDPGFRLADETEVPRLVEEALDRTMRIGRRLARDDEDLALLYVQLGERRLRAGLAGLIDRRLVAADVLRRFLASGPHDLTATAACQRAATRLRDVVAGVPGGLSSFLADGPAGHPQFALLAADLGAPGPRAAGDRDARRAGGLPRTGRPRPRILPHTGRGAAQGSRVRPVGLQGRSLPDVRRLEASPRGRGGGCAGGGGGARRLSPRCQRGPLARRVAAVRACARRIPADPR